MHLGGVRGRPHTSLSKEIAYAVLTRVCWLPLSLRPYRSRIGTDRAAAPRPSPAWSAALLAPAAARQRAVLCPTHRLCLALSPAGVSAVANGVHDMAPVAPAWRVATRPRGVAPRRPPASRPPR